MALEGSIKDFGVADILQLISQQQKTGVLLVEQQNTSAEIYFSAGAIVETRSPEQTAQLADLLVKSGMVTAEALKRIMTKAQEAFEPLGAVLLREGVIGKGAFERIVLTQIYETFYNILQWREGTYRFIPQHVKADSLALEVPSLESLLLDVLRMIDEWPDIQTAIHSFTAVFGRVPGALDDGLDEDETLIFNLIDGKKTVREIIDSSIVGRFATCKIIAGLFERGHIHVVGERTETGRSELITRRRIAALCLYALVLGALCVMLAAPTGFPRSVLPFLDAAQVRGSLVARYYDHGAVQKLTTALDLYFLEHNRYPDTLEELAQEKSLPNDDLAMLVATHGRAYARRGASYTLSRSLDPP